VPRATSLAVSPSIVLDKSQGGEARTARAMCQRRFRPRCVFPVLAELSSRKPGNAIAAALAPPSALEVKPMHPARAADRRQEWHRSAGNYASATLLA
jgi:hypothetical protein